MIGSALSRPCVYQMGGDILIKNNCDFNSEVVLPCIITIFISIEINTFKSIGKD